MNVQRKIAWCDWTAGMTIGLMPLLAHFVLWIAAKEQRGWSDNWTPDILFITISNSGLVAVSVFTRLLADAYPIANLLPGQRIAWGLTLASFALASMLYGADVTGMGNGRMWITACILMVFSGFCSLNFELALAGLKMPPATLN
jgi:hypothetical protein